MTPEETIQVQRIIVGLMVADNFGDVHEKVDDLRRLAGLPPLEGDYLQSWEDGDWLGTT